MCFDSVWRQSDVSLIAWALQPTWFLLMEGKVSGARLLQPSHSNRRCTGGGLGGVFYVAATHDLWDFHFHTAGTIWWKFLMFLKSWLFHTVVYLETHNQHGVNHKWWSMLPAGGLLPATIFLWKWIRLRAAWYMDRVRWTLHWAWSCFHFPVILARARWLRCDVPFDTT